MATNLLEHYRQEFQNDRDVHPADAESLFNALITETNAEDIAALLTAWNEKGWSEDELFGFATIMRRRMKRIESNNAQTVDIVGTGGSRAKTFNVSTAAAFVIAGAGVAVAKHGNRAATSSSGSSDVLTELGINVDIEPAIAQKCLNELGICFMFAPRFHSLSATLAMGRKMVGRPTIFNNLGPLCNPASAPHQVIGVWERDLLAKTANVLARLGSTHAWVVHGEGGLDEISLVGRTFVAEIKDTSIEQFEISAASFGIEAAEAALPTACSAEVSGALIREILEGRRGGDNCEKIVLINAAAAIYLAGHAADLVSAYEKATESICAGAALDKFTQLAVATNK